MHLPAAVCSSVNWKRNLFYYDRADDRMETKGSLMEFSLIKLELFTGARKDFDSVR